MHGGHYSTVEKNGIMPFAATWMVLEIITPSEGSQRKTSNTRHRLHVKSEETETDGLSFRTEIDPQTWQTKVWLPKGKGKGRDKLGGWD